MHFAVETETPPSLVIDGKPFDLGARNTFDQRLRGLGEGAAALVILNNTVPKSNLDQHFHIDPNRDTHSLLFHDLLVNPLPVTQRPVPRLKSILTPFREASPLNRCIPYATP